MSLRAAGNEVTLNPFHMGPELPGNVWWFLSGLAKSAAILIPRESATATS